MKLYCGNLTYEFGEKEKKLIESLIYWNCEKMLCEMDKDFSEAMRADKNVLFSMELCEKAGVPNWVGNGALAYGKDYFFKGKSIEEFFTDSKYSKQIERG